MQLGTLLRRQEVAKRTVVTIFSTVFLYMIVSHVMLIVKLVLTLAPQIVRLANLPKFWKIQIV